MLAAVAALAAVFAASGCGLFNTCGHPDEQELTCKALPAGSTEPGCQGRPPEDIGSSTTHTDERYPAGCQLTYPVCLAAYPDSPKRCYCGDGGGGTPTWSCPI